MYNKKTPQSNAPVERMNQVIYNMLVTKDLDKKVFEYIYPWGETLSSIAWKIRDTYHPTIGTIIDQYFSGRDTTFNPALVN